MILAWAAEYLWILDHPADVISDMSRFHRVTDIGAMPSPLFFAYASRLPYYDGAVTAAIRRAAADAKEAKERDATDALRAAAAPVTAEISRSAAFGAAPGMAPVFSSGPLPADFKLT